MPIKTRAHYLIFLLSWIVAFLLTVVVAQENGFRVSHESILVLILFLSLLPGALGYLAISKLASVYDDWRYRNGEDIYRQDQFEDDAGFIHLNQKSARINKHDTGLAEIFREVGGATAEAVRDDNPVDDR
jgi:hypothetical protein